MSELPPSGLRPPTKIGRPCSNAEPKPAVPQSPKGDGDTSTVRKISNEVAKKKLIDVDDGLSDLSLGRRLSIDRKSSQGSDSLWADVRKLSEAGVRRASDSSIVLTEDTDSFIIGDRVWVGGTKPGQIAYIGETQFAPGDWAGIVLDEPIGKNDGSVAGIRYFQCENRKGIFSRLTRLSRRPLTTNEDGLVTPLPSRTTAVSPGSSSSRISSPISPTGSITMPITHTGSRGGAELKVGDRVIVMNSNAGSKAGMLRYIGTTQFATGEWCGVELDDPLGKNDGSVQGVRYFECQDKFGLFAPVHKVSLSPSSSRRPSCAMHHSGTGLRKFGSKESITSVTSVSSVRSAARVRLGVNSLNKKPPSHSISATPTVPKRTPLQDVIKEKDIYIEQLLKERDLEKSEGILAASRVEAAEHKCDVLNQELVQFREEVEARDIDMQNFVKQLQEKNKELSILLDDERKRSEDLQFRFEEESINKGEVEVSNQMKEDRISQLEQLLKSEQVRREQLEKESNEFEETISKLRVSQEESDDKLSHLKASNEVNEKLIEQLKEQMDMNSVQLEETLSKNRKQEEEIMQLMSTIETSKILAVQKQDEQVHKFTIEIEALNKKLIAFETIIKENELNNENLVKEINDIRASSSKQIDELKKSHEQELERLKKLLREKEENLKNIEITSKSTNSELESIKDIVKKEKLEGETKIGDLNLQLNKLQTTLSEKEGEICSLHENLSKIESLRQIKDEEIKVLKESAEATEINLKKEVERLLNEFKAKEKEFSETTSSFKELESKMRSEIDKTCLNITDKETEMNNLKYNMELKQEQHNTELKEKEEKYVELKNLFERNEINFVERIENLSKELSQYQSLIKENEIRISKLLKEIEDEKKLSLQREEKIKKSCNSELENLQQQLTETELKVTNYENCFKSENNEFNEIKEMLRNENESAKSKISQLESELHLFKENCVSKEEEMSELKKIILELENNEKLKEEDSLKFKKSSFEAELAFKKQIENLEGKIKISENEFKLKEESLHSEILEMKNILEKTQKECLQFQNKSNDFETHIQENSHKMDLIIKDNENKIKNLRDELELKKKDYELIVKQNDDKVCVLEKNIQEYANQQMELNNKCNDYENQCKEKEILIENLKKDLEERKKLALSNSEETKTYFTNEIENLSKKFAESEVMCKKYENDLENKIKELDELRVNFQKENQENVDKAIEMEKQLQMSNDLCDCKSKEILDLKKNISGMEKTIKLKNEEEICLKESSLKIENSFKKEIEDITDKFKRKETELKNNENDLTKTINELKREIEEGKTKFTELEIKNKQLETDLKGKTNEIDLQIAEKDKLSILLNGLESNKSDHYKLLEEEQNKLTDVNKELENQKLEMIEQHKVLQDLRQRLNESDQRFNTQRELVIQQEHDLSTLRADAEKSHKQTSRLTSDVADWKNKLKTSEEKCSVLDEQKLKLEKDLESLKNSISRKDTVQQHTSVTTNGNDEDINYQMQIDFLNSVIVGLQHDKEALNAQILYLETGGISSTTNGNGSGRQITPRMYCDICEVFDAHETEDCPKQISDSPPPQQAHKPFPRGYQRPYCEDCEMFGHNTGECEDLTF